MGLSPCIIPSILVNFFESIAFWECKETPLHCCGPRGFACPCWEPPIGELDLPPALLSHESPLSARLEIEITDRFGKPVKAREWFLVPLSVIDEVVDKITTGTIGQFYYDPETAQLVR